MLRHFTRICVRYAERYVPDPFLYAVILTFLTIPAALLWTTSGIFDVIGAWYGGLFSLLAFSMQMALVLLTGICLADAPPIKRLLAKIAGLPKTQNAAATMVFLVSAAGSWLNWGFGIVVGAILAREIAKRLRDVDFSFIVAAAYAGFMVWASGLSSSIALAIASPGNALNLIERETGKVMGFDQTIFAPYNWVPVVLLLIVYPFVMRWMAPAPSEMKRVDPALLVAQDAEVSVAEGPATFASWLEQFPVIVWLFAAMAGAYALRQFATNGLSMDFNGIVCTMLVLGLVCHGRPIAYVRSFNRAAVNVGPVVLQYPFYGGIMGIITATGLAGAISAKFVAYSTAGTLPFWAFISSNIISLFVPSGGGHWAVQGPFMVPAAISLQVDPGMVAMAVAMGEQTANMIQPFWALPLLALARLGIRDIMGYCVMGLFVGLLLFGGSLLYFAQPS